MQDFLELGTAARMNYPSIAEGNWDWRLPPDALSAELARRIAAVNEAARRSIADRGSN
jgi:4-alpha-glucanotransferase